MDDETLAFAQRLFGLAREGDAAQLGAYLEQGLTPDLTNAAGDTLLILAAYHQHLKAVRVLLSHGADTERVNDRGQTALVAAVFRNDPELVAALLASGADPLAGGPNAVATARFFDLPDMSALLE